MNISRRIAVPGLVRIKKNALSRLGIYLTRGEHTQVAMVVSAGLPETIRATVNTGLAQEGVATVQWFEIDKNDFETVAEFFAHMPNTLHAVVGLGGGKALDMAKYLAFLAQKPYYAVPTSLSNDGFCSPMASLTIQGRRRSLAAALPHGVVIDVDVCLNAPRILWLSGVGDLVSKFSAVFDWKLAFHHKGELVEDLAALLSDASVYQFLANPAFTPQGLTQLGTALMLNGIAMEICGSSRPASGSEHLISHSLDEISTRPRLHGLQVGMATYITCRLQGQQADTIDQVFQSTGFWDAVRTDPFSREEWLAAVALAPSIKENFFTVLSTRQCLSEVHAILEEPVLDGCFV